ncbi:DNA integrity scanning protein DisA nucleotide-binding domain protein [Bacillus cereus group sp. BceL062]|uniref:DNA integrity scanning protein DisA nucleotide-binding domain protein n=1 Tax=Bacillus cereus group TaxID=86661 RepID=UPI0032195484
MYNLNLVNAKFDNSLLEVPQKAMKSLCRDISLPCNPAIIIASISTSNDKSNGSRINFNKISIVSNKYSQQIDIVLKNQHINMQEDSKNEFTIKVPVLYKKIEEVIIDYIKSTRKDSNEYLYKAIEIVHKNDGYRVLLAEFDKKIFNSYQSPFLEKVIDSLNSISLLENSDYINRKLVEEGRKTLESYFVKPLGEDVKRNDTDLFEIINSISLLKYEGTENNGQLLFCSNKDIKLKKKFILDKAIELSIFKVNAIRKLLEISGGNLYILCNGYEIFGIGEVFKSDLTDDNFCIKFKSHGKWNLEQPIGKRIMNVSYGVPRLPNSPITQDEYNSKFNTIFKEYSSDVTWRIVEAARKQEHGTMVVITDHAKKETRRLSNQAFLFQDNKQFPVEFAKNFTSIDGAILLSPEGECHAIGVILDGEASTEVGDIARGARYNSALRYLNRCKKQGHNCLIVIVSEDGMINLFTNKDL